MGMWKASDGDGERGDEAGAGGDVSLEAQDGHGAEQHDDGQRGDRWWRATSGPWGRSPAPSLPVAGLVLKR